MFHRALKFGWISDKFTSNMRKPDHRIRAIMIASIKRHACALTVTGTVYYEHEQASALSSTFAAVRSGPEELPVVSCIVTDKAWTLITTQRVIGELNGSHNELWLRDMRDWHLGNFKGYQGDGTTIITLRSKDHRSFPFIIHTGDASMVPIYAIMTGKGLNRIDSAPDGDKPSTDDLFLEPARFLRSHTIALRDRVGLAMSYRSSSVLGLPAMELHDYVQRYESTREELSGNIARLEDADLRTHLEEVMHAFPSVDAFAHFKMASSWIWPWSRWIRTPQFRRLTGEVIEHCTWLIDRYNGRAWLSLKQSTDATPRMR